LSVLICISRNLQSIAQKHVAAAAEKLCDKLHSLPGFIH